MAQGFGFLPRDLCLFSPSVHNGAEIFFFSQVYLSRRWAASRTWLVRALRIKKLSNFQEGHHGWLHWFNYPILDGGRPNIDVWPDVSSYSPSELFPASGLKFKSGEQPFLFSSRHPQTVQRHFHWMAEHGIDGAFLQRFAGQCDLDNGNEGIRRIRDEVGQRVREAAEKENRVFAIMCVSFSLHLYFVP